MLISNVNRNLIISIKFEESLIPLYVKPKHTVIDLKTKIYESHFKLLHKKQKKSLHIFEFTVFI